MRTLAEAFKESADAVKAGQFDKALELLIWIHDHPEPEPRSEMFRRACGFSALGVLATVYEPARAALVDLVEKKRASLSANPADVPTAADLRALEAALRTMGT